MRKYESNPAYKKFVNEILDEVIMESPKIMGDYKFFDSNGQFTFNTSVGIIDFFAQSDKMQIRNKKKWCDNGLVELLKALGIKSANQDKSRYQEIFNHMSHEHNLILVDSEIDEIVRIVKRIK